MKKLILSAFMAAVVLTACHKEEVDSGKTERTGEVPVNITVALPRSIQTYAEQQPTDGSAFSGLANCNTTERYWPNTDEQNVYVRCIMEVYQKTETSSGVEAESFVSRRIVYQKVSEVVGAANQMNFADVKLIAGKYQFVFWADIVLQLRGKNMQGFPQDDWETNVTRYGNPYFLTQVGAGSEGVDMYKNTSSGVAINANEPALRNIGVNKFPNSEFSDAYTNTMECDLRTEEPQMVTLQRPFAKLRVISSGGLTLEENSQQVYRSSLKGFSLDTEYDALKKVSSKTEGVDVGNSRWKYLGEESFDVATDAGADAQNGISTIAKDEITLLTYYVLPGNATVNVDLSLELGSKEMYANGKPSGSTNTWSEKYTPTTVSGEKIECNGIQNVPLVANKLTTLRGDLLTKNPDVTVTVSDAFDEGENEMDLSKKVETADRLGEVLSGGSEVVTITAKPTASQGGATPKATISFDSFKATNSLSRTGAPLYAEGNDAAVTLKFLEADAGTIFEFVATTSPKNAPKTLIIDVPEGCIVKIDMESTDIVSTGVHHKGFVIRANALSIRYDFGADVLAFDNHIPSDTPEDDIEWTEPVLSKVMYKQSNFTHIIAFNNEKDENQFKINTDMIDCRLSYPKLHSDGKCELSENLRDERTNIWTWIDTYDISQDKKTETSQE